MEASLLHSDVLCGDRQIDAIGALLFAAYE